jgi:hypothetical protein
VPVAGIYGWSRDRARLDRGKDDSSDPVFDDGFPLGFFEVRKLRDGGAGFFTYHGFLTITFSSRIISLDTLVHTSWKCKTKMAMILEKKQTNQ